MFMKEVKIYTVGASRGSSGPGGWAAVLNYRHYRKEVSGFDPDTTKNRMQLFAAIKGLEELTSPCNVTICSNSMYFVSAIEKKWIELWRDNDWTTFRGLPVKNRDLWERFLACAAVHNMSAVKLGAKDKEPERDRCDELAKNRIPDA